MQIDEWDGPPLVPASTYSVVESYQRVAGLKWDGSASERPVVMRGALHCRITSRGGDRGTPRHYAVAVLVRYVRRLRITETDPVRWHNWMHRHLLRMARMRPWWSSRWQPAAENDLRWLVCEYSVLIDGQRYDVYDPGHMQNVRKLARNARKYTGDLPTLPAQSIPARRMATNFRR